METNMEHEMETGFRSGSLARIYIIMVPESLYIYGIGFRV